MGCWNETCQITNLPIYENEEVMLFVVEDIRPKDKIEVGKYKILSAPIYGKYNDYGSLKEIEDKHFSLSSLKRKFNISAELNEEDSIAKIVDIVYEKSNFNTVFVKKEAFDIFCKEKCIKERVDLDLSSLEIKKISQETRIMSAVEAVEYCKRKPVIGLGIMSNFYYEISSQEFNFEEVYRICTSLEVILRVLRKSFAPLPTSQTTDMKPYQILEKYIHQERIKRKDVDE